MAVNLPTLSVPDAQATRILDTFKAQVGPDATTPQAVLAYKRWLADKVKETVLAFESTRIDDANATAKAQTLHDLAAALPDAGTIA